MRPFAYETAADVASASRFGREAGQGQTDAPTQFLAGGTTLIDLMKLDVLRPQRLVDINPLVARHSEIEVGPDGLRIGALAKMSAVAAHPEVLATYPALAQSLQLAASPQLRNMATLGGNVLQRTRCTYYRDPSWTACNKRQPGSGCAALEGVNRNHAVLGVDENCIAQYPGDLGVALIALGAEVELGGAAGARRIPFAELHRPAGKPHVETTLKSGELITAFRVPAGPWTRRSLYLKVRDRASYEFAIASAAVALDMDGEVVRQARIGLGGLAYRPWRAEAAEASLKGKPLTEETAEAAAREALSGAITHGHNAYKPELGRRTMVRALLAAKTMEA
ncbi:xanthine dehydrogenase family protein subunit M [Caulobacter sp. S45]|uniref:FAD binding domain-containing protein n=1 Tax=Caulobacter sp. S45 TaxID=1641861 RepID=UPI00131D636D|nr:xanthine dehydrogenase family protein subunit M [Caulobacter sp. S45]